MAALSMVALLPEFSKPLALPPLARSSNSGLSWSSTARAHPIRSSSSIMAGCVATSTTTAEEIPSVADTKAAFLKAYRRPIPSIYSTVLQELLVQQHLMRYNRTYQYDAVFALGFVTVFDQLMDGYPSSQDRDEIFRSHVSALAEDPEQYRRDAQRLEEWAASQNADSLVQFSSRDGEVESLLKDVAARAGGAGPFHYSRFFAIGLFRLVERANASDPAVLEQLCNALNVNKRRVDVDLDVYRNLLSKLAQAKELLKEYVERERKKMVERGETEPSEASGAVAS